MNHFASTFLSLSPVSLSMSGNPARAQHPAPRANAGIGVPLDSHGLLGTLGAGRGLTPRATQPMTPFPAGGVYPPTICAASHQPGAGMDKRPCTRIDVTGLMAGVGRHGGAPLCDTASHEESAQKTFSRLEDRMGLRGPRAYLTEAVMEEAEEADEAVDRLVSIVIASVADGRITTGEMAAIRQAGMRAAREARDVVHAAEVASIAQRMADNAMRGELAESTRRRGHDAGLTVPEWSVVEPRDAA